MSSRKQYSYAILEPDEEGVQKVSFLTTGNKGFMAGREFILICGVWIRMLSSSSSSGALGSCPDNYSIFKMEKDYSGWNLIYKVDLERIINAYHLESVTNYNNTIDYCVWVMFLGEAEEKSSTKLMLLINATQLISYDLKEMSYREIYYFNPKTLTMTANSGSRGYVHQYIESLAC
ncbi:hypothetical protein C5167_041492, partial [Papaver somniferum]